MPFNSFDSCIVQDYIKTIQIKRVTMIESSINIDTAELCYIVFCYRDKSGIGISIPMTAVHVFGTESPMTKSPRTKYFLDKIPLDTIP